MFFRFRRESKINRWHICIKINKQNSTARSRYFLFYNAHYSIGASSGLVLLDYERKAEKYMRNLAYWRRMHHCANILSYILLYIPLSLYLFISIASISPSPPYLHLPTHRHLPRRLHLPRYFYLSPYRSKRKLFKKGKAQQTNRCVLPIDREIAYKFCFTWLKQQHIELKTTKLRVLSYILLVLGRTYIQQIITDTVYTWRELMTGSDYMSWHKKAKNYHRYFFKGELGNIRFTIHPKIHNKAQRGELLSSRVRRSLRRNKLSLYIQTSPKKFMANWLGLTEHIVLQGDFSGEIDWICTA